MRGVSIHLHFKYDAVVLNIVLYDVSNAIILPHLDIPLVRVLDIIPAHVVAEPPVILLAVEHVPNLPGELGPLPLVNDPEVRIGVARPGAALRLSIALEEVSNTLGVAVLKTLQHINMVFQEEGC